LRFVCVPGCLCVRRHVYVCAGEKGGPHLSRGVVRAHLSKH
jgi:hypothetical protein